ncbi:hypothetical protein [Streptomyces sp. NPDC002078]
MSGSSCLPCRTRHSAQPEGDLGEQDPGAQPGVHPSVQTSHHVRTEEARRPFGLGALAG